MLHGVFAAIAGESRLSFSHVALGQCVVRSENTAYLKGKKAIVERETITIQRWMEAVQFQDFSKHLGRWAAWSAWDVLHPSSDLFILVA